MFLPRSPELSASAEELKAAEANLDISALVTQGLRETTVQRFRFTGGRVVETEVQPLVPAGKQQTAIV